MLHAATQLQWSTLAAAVLAVAVPVVRAFVLTKLTPSRMAHIADIARGAVRASEKLAEAVPGTAGGAKLDFAAGVVIDGARHLGVKLTTGEVLSFVHAALRELDQVKALAAEGAAA